MNRRIEQSPPECPSSIAPHGEPAPPHYERSTQILALKKPASVRQDIMLIFFSERPTIRLPITGATEFRVKPFAAAKSPRFGDVY